MRDWTIHLDLDGVLADYGHGMVGRGFEIDPTLKAAFNHSGTSHPLKREMYEAVKGTDFYRNLPLMPGAIELYLACYDAEPIILTAAPMFGASEDNYHQNPFWVGAAYHKRHWVEYILLDAVERERALRSGDVSLIHLSQRGHHKPIPDERFICTTSARKHEFMHRKHNDVQILIDDRIENVDMWASRGGVGILHIDSAQSRAALAELPHVREIGPDGNRWREGANGGLLFDPRI